MGLKDKTQSNRFFAGDSCVDFGRDIWPKKVAAAVEDCQRVFVFSQPPVWHHYGEVFKRNVRIDDGDIYVVDDGESVKNLATFERLHHWLAGRGADRSSTLLVLGGGVVGDLVGFVAASYMRGIPWIYVPTTLLCQQDASVGGKVAVNLPQGKNLVGHFWPPRQVVIDSVFLDTLPRRQLVAGFMELIKHGMLGGEGLLQAILAIDLSAERQLPIQVLAQGVQVKAEIVARDLREKGERQLLNLGHTLAHAIETTSDYAVLHGEAVGLGLVFATILARLRGSTYSWELVNRKILQMVLIPGQLASDEQLIDVIQRDKKKRAGVLTWVLPLAPGRVSLFDDLSHREVCSALSQWRAVIGC